LSALDKFEEKSQVKTATRDTIVKNINFNKNWKASASSNVLSVYVHNYMKAYEENLAAFEQLLRLPKIAVPTHYQLHLDARNVQTGALPYTGHVSIDATIIEATDKILLHSKDQVIDELKVFRQGTSDEIRVLNYRQNDDADTLAIYFIDEQPSNTHVTITIDYSTQLLTEIDGFYRDSYVEFDVNNQAVTKYLATTQFQAIEARRCFPSFDEPEYRAVFDIIITHDSSYSAVSNMPDTQVVIK
jgi:puromycin-sensitive aminopeptidase